MKVFVIGDKTLIGKRIVAGLEEQGHKVYTHSTANDLPFVLSKLNDRFNLTFHCLAERAETTGEYFGNLLTDTLVFNWAAATEQPRMVYLSHADVYPEAYKGVAPIPLSEYMASFSATALQPANNNGWVKMTGELSAQGAISAGVKVHVVRLFDYYGPDLPNTHVFNRIKQTAKDMAEPHKDEIFRRDWMHIDDVVAAIFRVIAADYPDPINICTGQVTSAPQMYRALLRRFHPSAEPPLYPFVDRKHNMIGNSDRLVNLGFTPRLLADGIADVTRWG